MLCNDKLCHSYGSLYLSNIETSKRLRRAQNVAKMGEQGIYRPTEFWQEAFWKVYT
jgi:hypothetical protein